MAQHFNQQQWQKELHRWYALIQQLHPGYGVYQHPKQYDSAFYAMLTLRPDTFAQAYAQLKAYVGQMHCGHSELYIKTKTMPKLNYRFLPFNGRFYIVNGDSICPQGSTLISINQYLADSLYHYLRNWVSVDGFQEASRDYFLSRGLYWNTWLQHNTSRNFDWNIKVCAQHDTITTCMQQALQNLKPTWYFKKFRQPRANAIYLERINSTTLKLKLNHFNKGVSAFKIRRCMKQIDKAKPEHLLIDVRQNPGGRISHALACMRYLIDSSYCFEVYRYNSKADKPLVLKCLLRLSDLYFKLHAKKIIKTDTLCFKYMVKPQSRFAYRGKVSVLINNGTFSAAVLLASALQWRNQTRFIGTETGGTAEGCNAGVFYTYSFKHLPMYYRLPLYRIVQHPKQNKLGHGIIPDIECNYSLDELLLKKDKETEKALQLPF